MQLADASERLEKRRKSTLGDKLIGLANMDDTVFDMKELRKM
jgi:hypothetical protein